MQDRDLPFGHRHPILTVLLLPFLALGAFVAGLLSRPVERTRADVAGAIKAFVDETGGPYDWDDFICGGRIKDPKIESIRARCASLPEEFPPLKRGRYCSEAGMEVMRGFIRELGHNEA